MYAEAPCVLPLMYATAVERVGSQHYSVGCRIPAPMDGRRTLGMGLENNRRGQPCRQAKRRLLRIFNRGLIDELGVRSRQASQLLLTAAGPASPRSNSRSFR